MRGGKSRLFLNFLQAKEKKNTIKGRGAREDLSVHIPPKHCLSVIHDKNRNCFTLEATKLHILKYSLLEILPLAYSNSTCIHPLVPTRKEKKISLFIPLFFLQIQSGGNIAVQIYSGVLKSGCGSCYLIPLVWHLAQSCFCFL